MTRDYQELRDIGAVDQDLCRNSSNFPTMFSSSIRNKEEFEFIKMLYRSIHYFLQFLLLNLIGLIVFE